MKLPLLSLASPSGCYQVLGQKWFGKRKERFWTVYSWTRSLVSQSSPDKPTMQINYIITDYRVKNKYPTMNQLQTWEMSYETGRESSEAVRDEESLKEIECDGKTSLFPSQEGERRLTMSIKGLLWLKLGFESFDTVTDLTSCTFREETEPHKLLKVMFKTGMDCHETYHRSTAWRSTAQQLLHTLAIHLRSWTFLLRSFMLHKYAFWGWLDGQKYKNGDLELKPSIEDGCVHHHLNTSSVKQGN